MSPNLICSDDGRTYTCTLAVGWAFAAASCPDGLLGCHGSNCWGGHITCWTRSSALYDLQHQPLSGAAKRHNVGTVSLQ